MMLPTLAEIEDAQSLIYRHMPPTAQYSWPLINRRLGAEVWIKHENHTPVGAFKLRGALVYMDWLRKTKPALAGAIKESSPHQGRRIGIVLTGGNVDSPIFAKVLAGESLA
jgi:threonine dehydratase